MVEALSQPTAGHGSQGMGLLDCRTAEATTSPLPCCLSSALLAQLMPPPCLSTVHFAFFSANIGLTIF